MTSLSLLVYITHTAASFFHSRPSTSSGSSSSSSFGVAAPCCFRSMETQSDPRGSDGGSPRPTIQVERNPPESRLSELGVKSWPKWGCPPGKFSLKFDAEETCYLLRGSVKAYTKGTSDCVEFGAGDLVVVPKGLSCTWEVSVAVDKYYKFDS